MAHKHCVFCGIEVPVPRPTSFSMICDSTANITTPDTMGNRYHAVQIGRSENQTAPLSSNPSPRTYTEAERDAAVAGAYRAAAELSREYDRRLTEDWEGIIAENKPLNKRIEALTPASAQKAFADAVAAEVAKWESSHQPIVRAHYEQMQQQLTRLTEEKERLAKALEKGTTRYGRDRGEPDPTPAFPYEVVFTMDEWTTVQTLLNPAQAALTPAAGGETRGERRCR